MCPCANRASLSQSPRESPSRESPFTCGSRATAVEECPESRDVKTRRWFIAQQLKDDSGHFYIFFQIFVFCQKWVTPGRIDCSRIANVFFFNVNLGRCEPFRLSN